MWQLNQYITLPYYTNAILPGEQCLKDTVKYSSGVIKVSFYDIMMIVSVCPMMISIMILNIFHSAK